MHNLLRLLIGSLLLSTWGCASAISPPDFQRFDPSLKVSATDYPDSKAVVLLDQAELRFQWDVKAQLPIARLRRRRRIQVLEADDSLGGFSIEIEPTTRIHGFRVRALTPSGSTTTLDHPQISSSTATGHLQRHALELKDVTVGTVIETVYDLWLTDLRFIPPFRFESSLPTVRSEYAVVVPPGFAIDLRFSQEGEFIDNPPNRFETPEGLRFTWSFNNLPARFAEIDMPSRELLSPRAHVLFLEASLADSKVKGFKAWDDVAPWFLEQEPRWSEITEHTLTEIQRIVGEESDEEKIFRLFEVIARDLKEVPDPPPLWRTVLRPPETILTSGHADPTNRGLLLVALLRAAGIQAQPALFAWRDQDRIIPDAATIRSLDGVAAFIHQPGGRPLVLNPSEKTASPLVSSPRLQGQRVVLVDNHSALLTQVPVSEPRDSRTQVRYKLELTRDGSLQGELHAELTGAEAGILREQLLRAEPDNYADVTGRFLTKRGASLIPTSVTFVDLRVLRRPLIIEGQIHKPQYLHAESQDIFEPVTRIIGGQLKLPREVRRTARLLTAPRFIDIRAILKLPARWSISFAPEIETLKGPEIHTSFGTRKHGKNQLEFILETHQNTLEVAARSHSAWSSYVSDLRALLDRNFGFKRPKIRTLRY